MAGRRKPVYKSRAITAAHATWSGKKAFLKATPCLYTAVCMIFVCVCVCKAPHYKLLSLLWLSVIVFRAEIDKKINNNKNTGPSWAPTAAAQLPSDPPRPIRLRDLCAGRRFETKAFSFRGYHRVPCSSRRFACDFWGARQKSTVKSNA